MIALGKVIEGGFKYAVRLVVAGILLFLSFLLAFGVGQHYFIAQALQHSGKEANVLVLEKIEPKRAVGESSRRFYRLKFADDRQVKYYSQANYPVGRYIDIVFLPNSPTAISLPIRLKGSPLHLVVPHAIARGTRHDPLIKLYLSSVKNDLADYGITHAFCAVVLVYGAVRILLPFSVKGDKQKRS
ncbi:MAG TPA: hypothetical protein V6C63_11750 [Allocoleopsis sp.]